MRGRVSKSPGTKAVCDVGGARDCVCENGEEKQVKWLRSRQFLLSPCARGVAVTLLILEIDAPWR